MRILYLHSDPLKSGSSTALLNIIKNLQDRCTIEVFLPRVDLWLGSELSKIGIKCIAIPFGLQWYPHLYRTWKIYRNIRPIRDFIRDRLKDKQAKKIFEDEVINFHPDIIHTNVGPLYFGGDIAHKLGIPHVWHIREIQDLGLGHHFYPSQSTFFNTLHSEGNNCIAITKGVFDYYKLSNPKDRVIYDGVIDGRDMPSYTATSPVKGKYFLYVAGGLTIFKGALDAFEAFRLFSVNHKGYKLVYVGRYAPSDRLYKILQDKIANNNLTDFVELLGPKETKDVYNLMHHAEAFLMLSNFEAFGFTTAEAMYNRCIVIGRDTAGTKEQFDNGVDYCNHEIGIRVNNVTEMEKAMEFVSSESNSEKIKKMKEFAYKTVMHLYTINRNTEEIYKTYLHVMERQIKS